MAQQTLHEHYTVASYFELKTHSVCPVKDPSCNSQRHLVRTGNETRLRGLGGEQASHQGPLLRLNCSKICYTKM